MEISIGKYHFGDLFASAFAQNFAEIVETQNGLSRSFVQKLFACLSWNSIQLATNQLDQEGNDKELIASILFDSETDWPNLPGKSTDAFQVCCVLISTELQKTAHERSIISSTFVTVTDNYFIYTAVAMEMRSTGEHCAFLLIPFENDLLSRNLCLKCPKNDLADCFSGL